MKHFCFALLFFVCTTTFAQSHQWAWAFGTGGVNGKDEAVDLVGDNEGNVYVLGTFESQQIQFGNFTLTNNGQSDVFLVKYAPQGAVLWARQFGGTGVDVATGMVIDSNQDLYITGHYKGQSMQFGSEALSTKGGEDIYLVKLDTDGNVIWAKAEGGSKDDVARAIAWDDSGLIYLTGDFTSGIATFHPIMLNRHGNHANLYVAQYDVAGHLNWVIQSEIDDTATYAKGERIITDHSGNVIVTGQLSSAYQGITGGDYIRFGNDTLHNLNYYSWGGTNYYDPSALLFKLSSTGDYLAGISDSLMPNGTAIAVDAQNNIYWAVQNNSVGIIISLPFSSIKLYKMNPNLTLAWERDLQQPFQGYDVCHDLKVNQQGVVYALGEFSSTQFGFGQDTLEIGLLGGHYYPQVFLLRFDANNQPLGAEVLGGELSDRAYRILLYDSNDHYITGHYESQSMTIGQQTLSNNSDTGSYHVHLMPNWLWRYPNMFVAKYTDNFTAVPDPNKAASISLYPNPARHEIHLRGVQDKSITLLNLQGSILQSVKSTTTNHTLQLQDYPRGMYLIKVQSADATFTTKLILY